MLCGALRRRGGACREGSALWYRQEEGVCVRGGSCYVVLGGGGGEQVVMFQGLPHLWPLPLSFPHLSLGFRG